LLKNYLKITWRNLKRNKIYSFINVFGLAVGMACCIVIILFVQDELSYDRFHENADRIFRLTITRTTSGQEFHHTITYGDMGPGLVNEFPEVVDCVRLGMPRDFIVESDSKRFQTDPVGSDPSILNIFTFPLIKGDKNTALKSPNNAVISEQLAEKLFGDEDPIGKIIRLYGVDEKNDFQVSGIMKNIPHNSHLRFDFLVPHRHKEAQTGAIGSRSWKCVTYLLLREKTNPRELEKKFPDFLVKHYGKQRASENKFILQPLTSIHLHSDLDYDEIVLKKGNITTSYSLSAVAFLILLIACINFMNLSTARATRRSKEVGLRKVEGASRLQLFRQFFGEAVFLSFVSLFLAVVIASLLLPFFNSVIGKHLSMNFRGNLLLYAGLILLSLFVGIISGSYPSIIISSFHPVEVLKGDVKKGSALGKYMRKGLVVFQFGISLIFIIGTIIIFQQMNFVKNRDLGFKKDNIIRIPIFKDEAFTLRPELIKRELDKHPNILKVIVTSGVPGFYNGWPIKCIPEGFARDEPVEINAIEVGEDYFDFFGVDIVQGRDFSKEIALDAELAVILNETAIKAFNWKFPVGKQIESAHFSDNSNKLASVTVIGVVKDFHNGSLHEEIKPTIYKFNPQRHSTICLHVGQENIQDTISFLNKKWRELPTYLILNYYFIDESLETYLYSDDRKVSKVFTFSSGLAIVLACMGLFGLASFSAERRIKEIGIRKVLGASISNIVLFLSKDFAKLVLIANIIAWPIGYYVAYRWMQDFAYRINISLWAFLLAAFLVFLITILTISFQTVKAANLNPVDTLRYE